MEKLTVSDFDPQFVSEARSQSSASWPLETKVLDPLAGKIRGNYAGVLLLDVLEHIAPEDEKLSFRQREEWDESRRCHGCWYAFD